jgi:hypothetical protein
LQDVEDLFHKYGAIAFIDLKNRRGPPFAFVEFEDPRSAVGTCAFDAQMSGIKFGRAMKIQDLFIKN